MLISIGLRWNKTWNIQNSLSNYSPACDTEHFTWMITVLPTQQYSPAATDLLVAAHNVSVHTFFSSIIFPLFFCIYIRTPLLSVILSPLSPCNRLSSPELGPADSCGGWKLYPFYKPSRWVRLYDTAVSHGQTALDTENANVCAWDIYEHLVVICVCVSGLHHEGIFRVPGSQREVNLLRDAFERGKPLPHLITMWSVKLTKEIDFFF